MILPKHGYTLSLNPQAYFTTKLDSPSLLATLKKNYSPYLVICLPCFFYAPACQPRQATTILPHSPVFSNKHNCGFRFNANQMGK